MLLKSLLTATALLIVMPAHANGDGKEFQSRIAGHVVLPAETFIDAPADAPADLRVSGKFANGPSASKRSAPQKVGRPAVQRA